MTAKPTQPAPRGFDQELAGIEDLRIAFRNGAPLGEPGVERVCKALGHRNNFLVSKAAKLAVEAGLATFLPEILTTFDRFFHDAAATDPQCWAKIELARALVAFEHRQRDAFLRGLRHIQLEPVWGGSADTAGPLRAICLHALVDCPGLSDFELLKHFAAAFVDTDKSVRMEAARGLANVGGSGAILLLRVRIHLGLEASNKEEPEVLGACFSALLALEGAEAVPLLAQAMTPGDEISSEAAYALAELRDPATFAALRQRLKQGADSWFAPILLGAMALTRLPEALDFLLSLIENESREAVSAIEAITRSAPSEELCQRLRQAVEATGSPRLQLALRENLPGTGIRGQGL
jgi:HEAT repeat protein